MSRSAPSYAPIARLRVTAPRRRRQRGHRDRSTEMTRHDGSGSPHVSQTGGVMGTIDDQQPRQTGPAVGSSSGPAQQAQAGASSTASAASAILVSAARTAGAFPITPSG